MDGRYVRVRLQYAGSITAICLVVEGGVLLRYRVMSPDVSIRLSILTAIVCQGGILAITAFGAFNSRVRYVCLAIAASAPLMLMCLRNTE